MSDDSSKNRGGKDAEPDIGGDDSGETRTDIAFQLRGGSSEYKPDDDSTRHFEWPEDEEEGTGGEGKWEPDVVPGEILLENEGWKQPGDGQWSPPSDPTQRVSDITPADGMLSLDETAVNDMAAVARASAGGSPDETAVNEVAVAAQIQPPQSTAPMTPFDEDEFPERAFDPYNPQTMIVPAPVGPSADGDSSTPQPRPGDSPDGFRDGDGGDSTDPSGRRGSGTVIVPEAVTLGHSDMPSAKPAFEPAVTTAEVPTAESVFDSTLSDETVGGDPNVTAPPDETPSEATVMLDPEMQDRLMALRAQQDQALKQRFAGDVVVMFTDLVGSTAYYEKHGDLLGRQKMLTHNALLFPIIRSREGTIIKTIGDAIMCCYQSVDKALQAAKEMQESLAAFNHSCDEPDDEIHIRIGINSGPAIAEDGDLHGDAVNVAARVEAKADGDEILVSESVKEAARSGDFELKGRVAFKGKSDRVSVFRLVWSSQARRDESAPRTVGRRYRQGVTIGRGPVGVVYSAEDTQLQTPVALKVLHDFIAQDPESMAAFREHFRVMASLRHDAIVRLLDFSSEDADETYYVMDRVEGQDLAAHVSKRGALDPDTAVRIILDIAPALSHAHDHAVIHANIKPENIFLVGARERGQLSDFGISAVHRVQGTRTGRSVASPAFQAPEQVTNDRLHPQTDVYALGAVLYYLLAGRAPYDIAASLDNMRAVASGLYKRLPQVREGLPRKLVAIIEKAMATRQSDRFASVKELSVELENFLSAAPAEEARASSARAGRHSASHEGKKKVAVQKRRSGKDAESASSREETDRDRKAPGTTTKELRSLRRALIAVSVLAGLAFVAVVGLAVVLVLRNNPKVKSVTAAQPTPITETKSGALPEPAPARPAPAPDGDVETAVAQETGTLIVNTGSVPADIYIDGEKVGRTPVVRQLELPVGIHSLKVEHPKRQPYLDKVEIKSGRTLRKRIKLKRAR